MNHINVSMTVSQTAEVANGRIEGFFREFAPEAEMTFTLRAPFDIAALRVGLTLQRGVTARFTPLSGDSRAYAIAWQPVAAGPFPSFSGTLFITSNERDADESIVTLDGHYHPPMGLAGDIFDVLVGKHIAQASATDLLERLSMFIDETIVPSSAFAVR